MIAGSVIESLALGSLRWFASRMVTLHDTTKGLEHEVTTQTLPLLHRYRHRHHTALIDSIVHYGVTRVSIPHHRCTFSPFTLPRQPRDSTRKHTTIFFPFYISFIIFLAHTTPALALLMSLVCSITHHCLSLLALPGLLRSAHDCVWRIDKV